MNGLLYIDKPVGWTSFDVVAKIRGAVRTIVRKTHESRGYCRVEQNGKRLRPETTENFRCKCKVKVGHTGTLDPAATGLLVICVGSYTKKVPELIKQDKSYEVEATLGAVSTTGDIEGEITKKNPDLQPEVSDIQQTVQSFVGDIQQIPPIFSAIKIDGKRAYDLARKGKEVVMSPRQVHIESISELEYDYPIVRFVTRVGSGTYIRSLVQDIGQSLGTGAYMSALRRTSIGDVSIDQALPISELTEEYLIKHLE